MRSIVLTSLLVFIAAPLSAKDARCNKMSSWEKLEGYRYNIVSSEDWYSEHSSDGDEDGGGDDGDYEGYGGAPSMAEGSLVICNSAGDVVWSTSITSEYVEYNIDANDLNGDKKKEFLVTESSGTAYNMTTTYILQPTKPTFTLLQWFTDSMADGTLLWKDLDEDGIEEMVYSYDDLSCSNCPIVPTVYAFEKDGKIKKQFLSKYPTYFEELTASLSSDCFAKRDAAVCNAAVIQLELEKNKETLDMQPAMPALPTGMEHALVTGWTADGAEFGYCNSTQCEVVAVKGKKSRIVLASDAQSKADYDLLKKALRQTPMQPIANDLRLVWKYEKAAVGPTLKFGAQRPGNKAAYLYTSMIDSKKEGLVAKSLDVHPEAILLSTDKKTLGVVSHFYDGSKSMYKVGLFPMNEIVGNAYNVAGLEFHKKENFETSASLFSQAYAADKNSKYGAFNLACAYARLGQEEDARRMLEVVVSQKNKEVIAKLATDGDLASLRELEWFQALIKK